MFWRSLLSRSRISRYELLADKRRIFHRQFGILSKKAAIMQITERADVAEKVSLSTSFGFTSVFRKLTTGKCDSEKKL